MITLTKIAKLANVSVSTASKAFSMSLDISEETRANIFKIAKEHGVFKKFYNAKYPRLVIAIVCPEFNNDLYANMLSDLQTRLEERECDVCVAATHFSEEREREILSYYSKYTEVDAILTIHKSTKIEDNFVIPCVDIFPRYRDPNCPTIISNQAGMEQAIKYFKSKSIETIGFISESRLQGKLRKFKGFMKDIYGGYDEDYIVLINDLFEKGGYYAAEELIHRKRVPRALFCESDSLAMGAMRALMESGYRIPDDVAIVGFNNSPKMKFLTPSLSTVDFSYNKIVEAGVSTVIHLLLGKDYDDFIEFDSEFIPRESSVIREVSDGKGS